VCTDPNGEADAVNAGHGVHIASIAGGNTVDNRAIPAPNLPAPRTQISGAAPCAKINSDTVCNATPGPGGYAVADSIAAANNAIADGVNAIKFSVGSGTSPWSASDIDRAFLNAVNDGIFVAASAGNTTATITRPIGQVEHRGPWLNTVPHRRRTNSSAWRSAPPARARRRRTHRFCVACRVAVRQQRPPAAMCRSATPPPARPGYGPGGFPANFFAGSVALIVRGACNFTEKMDNAAAGPAVQLIQTYSLLQVDGQNPVSFITANGATPTTTSFDPNAIGSVLGDMLAAFWPKPRSLGS